MMEDPGNQIIFLIFKDKFPQDYAQIVAQTEKFMKSNNSKQDYKTARTLAPFRKIFDT